MRKTQIKRQRIPRRGPGVAELEKILKEQEGQDSEPQFQDISPPPPPPPSPPPSFLFQPPHQSPSTPSLNNPPRPPPPPLPFLPPRDYSSWSNLPSFPTFGLIPPALPTAADAAEKTVFPTTTPKSDTQMTNIPPHFFPHFQFSASSFNRQYYNSMVNFIPGSASSSPSASSSAARYFHQIEHPSSQRSTDFNHTWTSPEEHEQMVNAKRARPFLDESHGDPNYQSRRSIPIFSNMAVKDSSSSSSSSLEINRTAINLDSNFRGTKRGFAGQLMSSSKSSGSYQLAEDSSNLMALGSSSTPNQFAPFDFQEIMEASQHRDEGGSASYYNKITFNSSSLYESNSKSKSKDILVAAIGSEAKAEDEDEAKRDGIDLDLKL